MRLIKSIATPIKRLLAQLAAVGGAGLIGATDGGTVQSNLDSRLFQTDNILSLCQANSQQINGRQVNVRSFYDTTNAGGGTFYWDASANKNTANGGTIIDPSTLGGYDGTAATRDTYLAAQGTGTGSGCWVRSQPREEFSDMSWFGGEPISTSDESKPILLSYDSIMEAKNSRSLVESIVSQDAARYPSRLASQLAINLRDIYVLIQGDSTSTGTDRFAYLTAGLIAAAYPAYSVDYIAWNHTAVAWDAAIPISTGTGAFKLHLYNGSYPGSVPAYWSGSRKHLAYDSKQFDVVISNYGLNLLTDSSVQISNMAEYFYMLKEEQPQAETYAVVQELANSTDRPGRVTIRVDAVKRVADAYGFRVIDVHALFLALTAASGGDYTQWYMPDDLHPSPAGSAKWADLVLSTILWTYAQQNVSLPARVPTLLPNGDFANWDNGGSSPPIFWTVINGATATRDNVNVETGLYSFRVNGIGTSGTSHGYIPADEIFERFSKSEFILIAARVIVNVNTGVIHSPSGYAGMVFAAHSVSTTFTQVHSQQPVTFDPVGAFHWVFLYVPQSFWLGNSDFAIGVFGGQNGEYASVDRIVVSTSLVPSDSSGLPSCRQTAIYQDTSGISVAAGATQKYTYSAATLGLTLSKSMRVHVKTDGDMTGLMYSARVVADEIDLYITNITTAAIVVHPSFLHFTVYEA